MFLHYVLDEWFAEQVQPRLRGPSTLVRYCDDFVMLFAQQRRRRARAGGAGQAAGEVRAATAPGQDPSDRLPAAGRARGCWQTGLATTFNFLGFPHVWVNTRKGKATVWQLTAKDRLGAYA